MSHAISLLPDDAGLRIATSDGRRRQAIDTYLQSLAPSDQPAFAAALVEADVVRYDALLPPFLRAVSTVIGLTAAQTVATDPEYFLTAAQLIQRTSRR